MQAANGATPALTAELPTNKRITQQRPSQEGIISVHFKRIMTVKERPALATRIRAKPRARALRTMAVLTVVALGLLWSGPMQAQDDTDLSDRTWRFSELEHLLYIEDAETTLAEAAVALGEQYELAERRFRLSAADRLAQYGCPAASSLAILEEHIDLNVTTARLYMKYGHYFLCIRQYDDAIDALSKAIPLFRAGYGREALMERTDPAYLAEVRDYYDNILFETMTLMEAAGAHKAYRQASLLNQDYWPQRFDNSDEILMLRGSVIEAWEEALQLMVMIGLENEADEARQMLRTVLTFDRSTALQNRTTQ
jgi:tetratricopeptide (TPR) repeat protein